MPSDELLSGSSANLSEQAYQALKRDILAAALRPGARLALDKLSEHYAIGVVPLREALNRLSSEKFVERRSQRGFFVAGMSISSLDELVKTRIWLETKALSETLAVADDAWEDDLVLAFHRLERTQRLEDGDSAELLNPAWEECHKAFHLQLISLCGSSLLLGFCSSMMDQAVRYRNLSMNVDIARRGDAIGEHRALLEAAVARDADRATQLLEAHYRVTLKRLRPVLE
ncbi:GntR family transcriptional regulator [Palleronia pelagia]|uniref:Transcriptional regulator, GntR family n=1 Tax=Palleronia pelagia TaxID=387096 RepID=A0A1H8AHG2_9RHOB|nr:GntR family transcriptional regulator [Palleronia pelagia]SEM70051.1 transcriptional regulator, GntR family [Palleronia pelagia]